MPLATRLNSIRVTPNFSAISLPVSQLAVWALFPHRVRRRGVASAGGVVFNPVFFGAELDDLSARHALVDGVFAPLREGYLDTRKRLRRVWTELWFAGTGIIT
ncbi:Uncharacterised protein [Enterobacter hormaechei]|nr:Uncharacterised protein [Enterobacter hormaechei]